MANYQCTHCGMKYITPPPGACTYCELYMKVIYTGEDDKRKKEEQDRERQRQLDADREKERQKQIQRQEEEKRKAKNRKQEPQKKESSNSWIYIVGLIFIIWVLSRDNKESSANTYSNTTNSGKVVDNNNTTQSELNHSSSLIKLSEKQGYYYEAFLHQVLFKQINLQENDDDVIKKASFSKANISPYLQDFTLYGDEWWLWHFRLRFVEMGDLNGDNIRDVIIGTHSQGGGTGGNVAYDLYFILLGNGDGIFRQIDAFNLETDLQLPQNVSSYATIKSISSGYLLGELNYTKHWGRSNAEILWESTPAKYELLNSLRLKLIEYEQEDISNFEADIIDEVSIEEDVPQSSNQVSNLSLLHETIWSGLNEKDISSTTRISFFNEGEITYHYLGQCSFDYPLKTFNNEIIMYWDIKSGCVYNVYSIFRNNFGLSRTPKVGKPFAKLRIIDSELLMIDYYYPEWVKRFNEEHKKQGLTQDDIFPEGFINGVY